MTTKTLGIHSENILPIIKKWLYSDRDIFLRELVSNGTDALSKLKVLKEKGQVDVDETLFRIDVSFDREKKTVAIRDNGIGMTAEEVEKYIAQIAFSGALDFAEQYEAKKGDQFIGHFGLGFYSAFMVASIVEVHTLSYKEGSKAVLFTSDGTKDYEIKESSKKERGTEIILHIAEDSLEMLQEEKLLSILNNYCSFLPYPIYLGEKHVNHFEPLWLKAPTSCSEKEVKEFYKHLYPFDPEPLFWVHLNVDYPFSLKGILYFPKITPRFDLNKSTIKLYCNRVFVSDDIKEIVPSYAAAMKGVLESSDLPLNVSRSYLQMDKTVRQFSAHISKKVADSLIALYKTDKERFLSIANDLSYVIKLGILEEEKFYDRIKEVLLFKKRDGSFLSLQDLLEEKKESQKKTVYYVKEETQLEELASYKEAKGESILVMDHVLDTYVMPKIEAKETLSFKRLDASMDEELIDKKRAKGVLDHEGKSQEGKIEELVRSFLGSDSLLIQAKSLAIDSLPGFVVIGEEERRMKEWMKMMQPDQTSSTPFSKATFVVNTNNPLILAATKVAKKEPKVAGEIVKYCYDLALLSQQEMDPRQVNTFAKKSSALMESLLTLDDAKERSSS